MTFLLMLKHVQPTTITDIKNVVLSILRDHSFEMKTVSCAALRASRRLGAKGSYLTLVRVADRIL